MAKSGPGKLSKGKGLFKWTSENQTQNIEMKVTELGFFCSRCKMEWLEPQTDSSTSDSRKQRRHQEGGCDELLQGKEEEMRLTGFYCEKCNLRLLFREWKGNNIDTKCHHKTQCSLTESSFAENLQAFGLTGYYCSMCKQEWSLTEDATPSQRVVDGICLQFHTKCNGEIKREVKANVIAYSCHQCKNDWQLKNWGGSFAPTAENFHKDGEFLSEIKRYEGSVKVIGYFCPDCDAMRSLEKWHVETGPGFENAIRDYHASTGCPRTFQKYEEHSRVILYSCTSCKEDLVFKEWYGNPVPNTENALRDHHHKTGCRGTICAYKGNGIIIGYFCSDCKKEWLLQIWNGNPSPDINYKPVDNHVVPMFWCLQVSDTGRYVKWKNIKRVSGVTEGDHVVWPRCLGYWHHAIVENVNDKSLKVIEWNFDCNSIKIKRTIRRKWNLRDCVCCSYMYKVIYPEEVLSQNPAPLVLSRARARLNQEGYNLFFDNCEHFATFCKTGCHQSAQLFRLGISFHGWLRRFVASLFHIILIATIPELLESRLGEAKDWIGVISQIVIEILYLFIVVCVIYQVDTTRTAFTKKQPPECSKVCRCASLKAIFQSAFLLGFAIFFSVFVKNLLVGEDWNELPDLLVEICLGILGGGVGNMVGFCLYCCPCCCCTRDASEQQTCTNTATLSSHDGYEYLPGTNEQTSDTRGASSSSIQV